MINHYIFDIWCAAGKESLNILLHSFNYPKRNFFTRNLNVFLCVFVSYYRSFFYIFGIPKFKLFVGKSEEINAPGIDRHRPAAVFKYILNKLYLSVWTPSVRIGKTTNLGDSAKTKIIFRSKKSRKISCLSDSDY